MSPILVVLTSRCDSDFECSNISFNQNKLDDTGFERTEEKFYGFRQTGEQEQ